MGSLSNLYISQSYQSLIHIGTNNTASATLIGLQDGLGNNIGVSVNTAGDLFLSGSLTASLQQGYLYVGNASGKTTAFATSSLVTTVNTGSLVTTASFNAFTQSINSATQSLFTSASLALVTASFDNGTRNLTFTKGNNQTFNVNIPDVSGSTINTGSFATTGSNQFNGSQTITGSLTVVDGATSFEVGLNGDIINLNAGGNNINFNFGGDAAFNGDTITLRNSGGDAQFGMYRGSGATQKVWFTKVNDTGNSGSYVIFDAQNTKDYFTLGGVLNNTTINSDLNITGNLTASLQQGYAWVGNGSNVSSLVATSSFGTPIPSGTISGSSQITALGFVSSSVTASSLITASFSGNTLTFTKGDASTFGVVIPDVSGSTIDTGSFATTSSFNSYTQSTNIRLNNLESTSASVNVSITNLNSTTSSFATSIANLNSNSASVNTSITNLNASSASQQVSIDALNTFTASQSTASIVTSINNLNTFSASALVSISNINSTTASLNTSVSNLNTNSASQQVSIDALNVFTASQSTASLVTSITELNTFSASAKISITNINSTTASLNTSASLALVTASFDNGTRNLTFTKGNNTQFSVNIPDVSGSAGTFVTTSSFNAYTQSNDQRVTSLETNSASVNTSISNINSATASLFTSVNALNTFTASQSTASIVTSITNLNSFTQSANQRIGSLEAATSSYANSASVAAVDAAQQSQINSLINATSSYAISASVAAVDAAQQQSINSINAVTASFLTSSADISALNAFTASQLTINSGYNTFTSSANQRLGSLETNSASVNTSISALNSFTASQSTASLVTSITELNTFSASAKVSINALNTNSASVNTSVSNLNTFTQSQAAVNILLSDEIDSLQAKTGSYATTGSNNFIGNQTITGNISAFSASFTYLQTIFESSSIIYSSGSNQFGDELTDVQTLSGSVKVQGSLTVNGTPVLTSSVDISGLVTTASFNTYTQSNNQRVSSLESNSASVNVSITNINSTTASLNTSVSALNTFTASQSTASLVTSINNLNTFSASALVSISNLNSTTASLNTSVSNINTFTQSANQRLTSIESVSGSWITESETGSFVITSSFNSYTQSNDSRVSSLESATASLYTSVANINTFTQSANISINALNAATSSYVTSAITASSLITASFNNGTRNLTFTKGDATTFNVNIPDVSGSTINTGSFATTGSNTFIGNQTITGSLSVTSSTQIQFFVLGGFNPYLKIGDNSLNDITLQANDFNINLAGGDVKINNDTANRGIQIEGPDPAIALRDTTAPNNPYINLTNTNNLLQITDSNSTIVTMNTASFNIPSASFTASLQQGYAWVGNSLGQNTQVATSSFGSTINTGSFATTGSNTFIGNETFQDAGGNASTLVPTSGSLMLVAKSFTSASAHLSSSFTNSVNLIFKNNDNTADTIISGSNNIFTNPTAITTGFKRYIGGSSNIAMNASAVPQISGSMGFSPAMSNNYFGGTAGMIMRGPVSSSAYTISNNLFNNTTAFGIGSAAATNAEKMVSGFTMSNNVGNVFVRLQAYKTPLSASVTYSTSTGAGVVDLNLHSSSINYGGNISYGGTTINNLYFPTTVDITSSLVTVNSCQFMGTNNIVFSGSNASMTGETRRLGNSLMIGFNSASLVLNGDSGSLFATSILGAGLSVTGSNSRFTTVNVPNNDFGSAFVGRYNDQSGNKARTAETIFAVGTGTANATANRKTGFLIDSGSNTYVEGSLNVSGSTSLTGSLTLNGSTITAVNTGSFATTGSNSFNGNQTITGSLILSSSANVELQVIGNQIITGSLIVSSSGGEFNRFNTLDTTIQRIQTSLSFTGSRFGGGILSTSIELENLSATEFGFNQLSSADALTGTQFILNTNKDSTFTELKLNARYTGSNDATIKIRNTAGVRTFTSDADTSTFNGNVKVASTFQLQLPVGSNQQAGTAVLDGGNPGTVTVSNSLVTASSVIMLTKQTLTNAHMVAVSSKGAGTFTITSNGNGDADTVGWFIINNS